MKLLYDSAGNHFITDCDIYHFYGAKTRDFFSAWVLRETQRVVRIPMSKNQHMGESIHTVITAMAELGYKHELI